MMEFYIVVFAIAIVTLGFFATLIALSAIARKQTDVANKATEALKDLAQPLTVITKPRAKRDDTGQIIDIG